jgi:hypothetical protein
MCPPLRSMRKRDIGGVHVRLDLQPPLLKAIAKHVYVPTIMGTSTSCLASRFSVNRCHVPSAIRYSSSSSSVAVTRSRSSGGHVSTCPPREIASMSPAVTPYFGPRSAWCVGCLPRQKATNNNEEREPSEMSTHTPRSNGQSTGRYHRPVPKHHLRNRGTASTRSGPGWEGCR